MRRPLFAVLCGAAAAVWLTIRFIHWSPGDYEPFRGREVCLEGTVRSLEPKLEGDGVVWRMTLTGISFLEESSPEAFLKESSLSDRPPSDAFLENSSLSDRPPSDNPVLGRRDCVLCVMEREPALQMTARVRVRGRIYPFRNAMNEGEFDARLYYHILRVEFQLRDTQILAVSAPADRPAAFLYKIKKQISSVIDRTFSNQNSPVVKAMLLGEKGLLEEETKELYQGAGIIHILSISGLHLSLLGMGLFLLLGKIRVPFGQAGLLKDKKKSLFSNSVWIRLPISARAAVTIILVYAYGKMTGMGTSVFRALVMFSLFLIAKSVGRTYDLLTAAAIAWTLLLFDQPLYLLHTGFQFSFCAVLSIGILLPALPGRFLKGLAIPLGTAPVYLWNYGTFPLYSLLLNLVVIPLMGVVMISGGAAVLIGGAAMQIAGLSVRAPAAFESAAGRSGSAFLFPARIAGLPAELILNLYRFLASMTEKLPGHMIITGRPAPFRILIYYIMLLMLAGLSTRLRSPAVRRRIEHTVEEGMSRYQYRSAAGFSGGHAERGGPALSAKKRYPCSGVLRNEIPCSGLPCSEFPGGRESRKEFTASAKTLTGALRGLSAKGLSLVSLYLRDNRERRIFGTACSALWLLLCVAVLTLRLTPAFEMDFLYVGQGDGIFITSGGRNYLIDGGSTSNEGLVKYTLIPFLHCKGVRKLDAVLITHEDRDHCSGVLELLEAAAEGHPDVRIGSVYLTDISDTAKGDNYHRIEELADAAKIPVCRISRGDCLRSGKLSLFCLHPAKGADYEDANQSSMTLLLEYGKTDQKKGVFEKKGNHGNKIHKGFSALLTGDLEGQGEEDMIKNIPGGTLRVDLLKAAHHGSRGATSEAFLDKVTFNTAVISAGINNMYGHPHKELLERIGRCGAECHRTDLEGEISVRK